jgi:hypothetical protein
MLFDLSLMNYASSSAGLRSPRMSEEQELDRHDPDRVPGGPGLYIYYEQTLHD